MNDSTVQVLLVEDNEVDVEGVRRAFRSQKIANPVLVARDGVEALAMLKRGEVRRPFLVLLDLNLPRMGGIELLQKIRKDPELHDSIVFVLTTSASDEDKVASYQLNVAGYIVKSDVGQGFMRLIELLDHYWRVVEFPPRRDP